MDKGLIKRTYGIWRRQRPYTGKDTALFNLQDPAKILPDQIKIWPKYFVLMLLYSDCSHKVTEDTEMGRGFKKKEKKKAQHRKCDCSSALGQNRQVEEDGRLLWDWRVRNSHLRVHSQPAAPQLLLVHVTWDRKGFSLCHISITKHVKVPYWSFSPFLEF